MDIAGCATVVWLIGWMFFDQWKDNREKLGNSEDLKAKKSKR